MIKEVEIEAPDGSRWTVPLFDNSRCEPMSAYVFKRKPVVRQFVSEETIQDAQNKVRIIRVRGPQQVEEDVEVYNRNYALLGVLVHPSWDEIASHPNVVDTWDDWTGGATDEPGDMVCIDRAEEKRSALTTVCAWCGKVLQEGQPGKVSHGICKPCADQEFPGRARQR